MPERNPNADMRAANQPPVSKAPLAATPLLADAAETISCLLDLVEMYDKRLVQKGDPEHLVYSETHKDGIWKARGVLQRLKSANNDSTKTS